MVYENVFKAMLTTPIGPHEVIVGEFMWVALKGAFMSTGVSLVLCLFQLPVNPWMLLLVPLIGAAIAIPCGAMGLLATSFVRNINQFQTVYSFIISPLFFFSGIFFPLAKSPVWLQTVGYVFPLAHGVRIAQSLFWARDVRETVFIHLPILCIQGGLLCWFAAYRIRKKLQS
jgi:lipooligosaccharide transport system permease protein